MLPSLSRSRHHHLCNSPSEIPGISSPPLQWPARNPGHVFPTPQKSARNPGRVFPPLQKSAGNLRHVFPTQQKSARNPGRVFPTPQKSARNPGRVFPPLQKSAGNPGHAFTTPAMACQESGAARCIPLNGVPRKKSAKMFGGFRNYAYLCIAKIYYAVREMPLDIRPAFFVPPTLEGIKPKLHRVGIRKRPGGFSIIEP